MDKKKKIILIVSIALIIGVIVYFIMRKSPSAALADEIQKGPDSASEKETPIKKSKHSALSSLSVGESVKAGKGGSELLDMNYNKVRSVAPGVYSGLIKEISGSFYKVGDTSGNTYYVAASTVEKL